MAVNLDLYDTILFDMDGVITSEENYWDVSALAVYEMLHSKRYFGTEEVIPEEYQRRKKAIRQTVFCEDRTIKFVKNAGINSNWDLTYVVLGAALILGVKEQFGPVLDYLTGLALDAFALYQHIGSELAEKLESDISCTQRNGGLWNACTACFQEWFLGNKMYECVWKAASVQPGKKGLMYDEEPLVDKTRLLALLSGLKMAGKRLGIGTGRPLVEVDGVLDRWAIRRFFDPDAIITYTDIMDAERRLAERGEKAALTKPHPFMFLKGVFGREADEASLLHGDYDRAAAARTLVVGDAGADLYAARAGGCAFCAVLTGVQQEGARPFFEQEKADYILGSVLELLG